MYRNLYQRGMLTIFFSGGAKPLEIWDTVLDNGYVTRFLDQDIKSMVLQLGGTNVSTAYMTCPKGYPKVVLGITMPFLVMIVKNLKKYFSFEVTILDDTGTRRRFRISNFQSSTQILPLCTAMPIGLSEGWNQIQFNLAEFTRRAYKKQFVEVQHLKINANIRLRRIYFAERLVPEEELPPEYKLYFPLRGKGKNSQDKGKENVQHAPEIPALSSEERKRSKLDVIKPPSKQGSKVSIKKSATEIRESVQMLVEEPELAEKQKSLGDVEIAGDEIHKDGSIEQMSADEDADAVKVTEVEVRIDEAPEQMPDEIPTQQAAEVTIAH